MHLPAGRLAITSLVLLVCSCSFQHAVEEDYPQYLAKNQGTAQLPKTTKASEYFLTPHTQTFKYEFRSVTTGSANLWIVDFGKMLDDTLKSAEVQAAFGSLTKQESVSSSGNLLVFDLEDYTFKNFAAHIRLKVTYYRSGSVVFEKDYAQHGKSQGGKMFWGGAFAQRNAVQQSTKLALDEILRQLITDLNAQP